MKEPHRTKPRCGSFIISETRDYKTDKYSIERMHKFFPTENTDDSGFIRKNQYITPSASALRQAIYRRSDHT